MKKIIATTTIIVSLAGCAFGFAGNFSFSQAQCRLLNSSCVIEMQDVGYVIVSAGANLQAVDETKIGIRLKPRDGVVAAWSSAQLELVDRDNIKSVQLKVLDTSQVMGRRLDPKIDEAASVMYGPYSEAEFRVKPRISKMEIRFPPVLVNGRMVQVQPVQIDDGTRAPAGAIYYSH
jgi:hypothetical protein